MLRNMNGICSHIAFRLSPHYILPTHPSHNFPRGLRHETFYSGHCHTESVRFLFPLFASFSSRRQYMRKPARRISGQTIPSSNTVFRAGRCQALHLGICAERCFEEVPDPHAANLLQRRDPMMPTVTGAGLAPRKHTRRKASSLFFRMYADASCQRVRL